MHDVVVVGAGPAGAATAAHLAMRGRSVVLVDRDLAARRKACGEGLLPAGVDALASLGIQHEDIGAEPLPGITFHAGDHTVAAPFPGGRGLGVRRPVFDMALRALAQSAGAMMRPGEAVTGLAHRDGRVVGVETLAGVIEARYVAAADGLHSRLRRDAGLDRSGHSGRYGLSAHVRVRAALDPGVHVFFEPGFELYLTPVGTGAVNVALLCRRGFLSRFSGRLQAGFTDVIGAHPAFAAGFEAEDEVRVAGPSGRRCTRASRDNVVLVGDAAGFFDGISGDGMSAALVSARLCAEALDRALCGGGEAALHAYDHQRRAVTRSADLLARLSLLLAGSPRGAAIAVRNLSRRPSTFARLVSVSCGSSAFRSLGPRDALAMLAGL